MRGTACLFVALLTVGCVSHSAPTADAGPCVPISLHADRGAFAWGERANLTLHIANCDRDALAVPIGQGCYPEPFVHFGSPPWTFAPDDPHPRRSASGDCAPFATLARNESRDLSWSWDGLVWDDLVPCASSQCPVLVPSPSGEIDLVASLSVADQAFANVTWNAPATCAKLTLLPDHAAFRAGETMRARATLTNCGAVALPVATPASCFGASAFDGSLTGWNGTWSFDERGGPHRDTFAYSHGYCIGSFGTVRAVVDPGASFAQDLAWNGTMWTTDLCPLPNGAGSANCDHVVAAPAGEYELHVEYAGPDGVGVNATAPVTWNG